MSSDNSVCKVLVVDDDSAFLCLVERHLKNAGYQVFTASDGLDGMKSVLEHGLTMVVTDWMMPGMDGLEFCRAIRTNEAVGFVYLIILTAQEKKEHTVEAFDAGADDFLTKPFNKMELLARLRAGRRMIQLQIDLDRRNREVHLANAKMAIAARELEEANKKLQVLATTDELTNLLNRREAMYRLTQQWAMAERYGEPISCIMVDIDRFKKFNDTHGHAIGDLVLKEVAHTLVHAGRTNEDICRLGGEEFLVLCPRSTFKQAAIGAERLRQAVESNKIQKRGSELSVTISLGVAERTSHMKTPDDLLRAADDALYAAKAGGRNCVRIVEESITSLSSIS